MKNHIGHRNAMALVIVALLFSALFSSPIQARTNAELQFKPETISSFGAINRVGFEAIPVAVRGQRRFSPFVPPSPKQNSHPEPPVRPSEF
ncbi:hypothetical protein IEQ34_003851 [Dendrobium chrysotoxum]|uniref:Uncharacterized protein n=1 Tax=Dendrobium chrysotoxum TaxID=161865 RepID=A0AAV7HGI8_DENCH|nr:hypothetical protein IEQ34_003851 [Dendrobium chrysotoxum]